MATLLDWLGDKTKRAVAQVNPFDNGATWSNPNPQPKAPVQAVAPAARPQGLPGMPQRPPMVGAPRVSSLPSTQDTNPALTAINQATAFNGTKPQLPAPVLAANQPYKVKGLPGMPDTTIDPNQPSKIESLSKNAGRDALAVRDLGVGVARGIARIPETLIRTAAQPGASAIEPTATTSQQGENTGIRRFLYGSEPVKTYFDQATDLGKVGTQLTGNKDIEKYSIFAAPVLAAADLISGPGKKQVGEQLVKASTKEAVEQIAKKEGIKLAEGAAEQLAKAKTITEVKDLLTSSVKSSVAKDAAIEAAKTANPKLPEVRRAEELVAKANGEPVIRPPEMGPFNRDAKFTNRLNDNPDIPQTMKEGLQLGYNARPQRPVFEAAAKDIAERGPDTVAMELQRLTGSATDSQNAAGQLLMTHYLEAGDIEKATMVANKISVNSREAGRAISILQNQAKLTPEGALRDVMGVINKANEGRAPAKQIILTEEHAKEITRLATEVQKLDPMSREHQVAVGMLKKSIEDVVPPSLLRKVSTVQTIGQLLNAKTAVRNVLGNLVMSGLENVSGITAAGIDKAVDLLGGTRTTRTTVLPQLGEEMRGFFKGAKYGAEDVKLGIRTSGTLGQTEVVPNVFKNKVMHSLEQATGYTLSVPDRAFYQSAFDESVANQMKAQGLESATKDVLHQANQEALYRTFQNNSAIASALSKTKRGLNFGKDWGIGDLILKYPKTPGNILSVGLDYSPVGFVKGLAQFAGNINSLSPSLQRDAVMNISRGLTGTGLIAGGAYLAANGIITAKGSNDKDVAAADRESGQGPFSFNFTALQRLLKGSDTKPKDGDLLVNYDWLQPNSIQLSMGANLVLNHQDAAGAINNTLESFDAASSSVTQQPVLKGVSDFIKTAAGSNGQPGSVTGAIGQAVGGAPASFIPTALSQVGQATDNTSRNTYDPTFMGTVANTVKAKIPGLREDLPARVKVTGEDQQQYDSSAGGNNLFNVFLNPAFATKFKDNPVLNEVRRLDNVTGETTQYPRVTDKSQKVNGEQMKLSGTQLEHLQRNMGQTTMDQFKKIMEDPTYKGASDDDKVKILSNALTSIASATKSGTIGGTLGKDKDALAVFNGGDVNVNIPGAKPIAKNVSTKSRDILTKVATMEAGVKTKFMDDPKNAYEVHKAEFENDKANGELTSTEEYKRRQALGKESVTAKYSQEVQDLYGMSKNDRLTYLQQNPEAQSLMTDVQKLSAELYGRKFSANDKIATAAKGKKGRQLPTMSASAATSSVSQINKLLKGTRVPVRHVKTASFKKPKTASRTKPKNAPALREKKGFA